MSNAQFDLVFDGPALEGGQIDVRELSASLTALNILFEEADVLLNDGRTSHVLKLRGSFKSGSFKVFFASQQSIVETAKSLLLSDEANAISNADSLVSLLFLGGTGVVSLLGLLKWLAGRGVTKIIETDDKKFAVYSGDKFIKTEERVIKLWQDFKVRKAFENAIAAPLKEGQIETIAISGDKGKTFETVSITDKPYLEAFPEQRILLPSYTYEANVSLVKISFKEANKWTVFDGRNAVNVRVEDSVFLKKVDQSEVAFSKGDILRVRMRIDQAETSSGLRSEHSIEEVLEHRPPIFRGQLKLDVEGHPEGED
jgi:hypothetical protein